MIANLRFQGNVIGYNAQCSKQENSNWSEPHGGGSKILILKKNFILAKVLKRVIFLSIQCCEAALYSNDDT